MRNELYLRIKKPSLRYAYFLYFDIEPYLADQLFIRRKIRVWFDSHFAKQGAPYLGILCHVRKKNVPAFLATLEDLKKRGVWIYAADMDGETFTIDNIGFSYDPV